MNEKQLLYALGWVKDIYLEEMQDPSLKTRTASLSRKRLWLMAAIIALMLLLAGCAAVVLMQLERMTLRRETQTDGSHGTTEVVTELSRQGFAGTPNFQAAQEWDAFIRSYDTDHKIWDSLSNEEMRMPDEYYSYGCYTKEMTDKVDAICLKYGLETQGFPHHFVNWESICQVLGVENIVSPIPGITLDYDHGYMFQSGSFDIHCTFFSPYLEPECFMTIRCVSKGDFDGDFLTAGDLADYTQWSRTSRDGTEMLLALGPGDAFFIADKTNYFATVAISYLYTQDVESGEWFTREELETIADMFDFSFPVEPLSLEIWEAMAQQIVEDNSQNSPPPLGYIPNGSYAERVRWHLEEKPHPERLQYAFMDVDGDGSEDLLIGQDGFVCQIYMTDGTNTYIRPFFKLMNTNAAVIQKDYDEPVMMTNSPTYIQICEENQVVYVFEYTDGTIMYGIANSTENGMNFTEIYFADPENGIYKKKDEWGSEESATQEQIQKALDACVPIEVAMRPLREYPLD